MDRIIQNATDILGDVNIDTTPITTTTPTTTTPTTTAAIKKTTTVVTASNDNDDDNSSSKMAEYKEWPDFILALCQMFESDEDFLCIKQAQVLYRHGYDQLGYEVGGGYRVV